MANLKQSTIFTRTFLMVQSSDHITGITGATVAVKLSKAGGTGASAGGTVAEVDSTNNPGLYKISLTTTDTNTLGDLAFHCTATSADPTDFIDQVTVNILGDTLPANVTSINSVSTSSVTAVNANQGTTQPLNFTGTSTSALVKSDMIDIASAAVSTSAAQIGVNLVNINGSTASPSSAQLGVNLVNIAGSVVSTSTAQIGTNVVSVAAAASNIKKNHVLNDFMFVMVDATTGAPKTGLTITSTVSLDGGAFAATANSAVEVSNGWYSINLATTDTNANVVALRFTGTGASDRDISILTQP